MVSGEIVQIVQSIGLPTALSIYLLFSYNKQMEKYEALIQQITGEIMKLNENFEDLAKTK